MSVDLYRILGVPREATVAEVRSAFREKAKLLHPDVAVTGDRASFDELRLAHDILVDPHRRARYDATGDAAEATPDNGAVALLTEISDALMGTLEALEKDGLDPTAGDMARAMAAFLQQKEAALKESLEESRGKRAKMASLLGRFTSDDGEECLVETIISGQLSSAKAHAEALEAQLPVVAEARRYLLSCRYRKEP